MTVLEIKEQAQKLKEAPMILKMKEAEKLLDQAISMIEMQCNEIEVNRSTIINHAHFIDAQAQRIRRLENKLGGVDG